MKLKKLLPELASNLIDLGYEKAPREIQTLAIPKIKSGADLVLIAPDKNGKTNALLIGLIQQLKQPFEEAPRAIMIVSSREKAFEAEEQFQILAKGTKLRSFVAFDQGILQYQKDEIYDGLDILFVTPKRLTELVNINGVPMTKIKMLVVDDAIEFLRHSNHAILHRIADGIKNPQIILAANEWSNKFEDLEERLMKNPMIIEAE
ncbi:DEAD/DEAH box helicase [Carboxylicivirga linearis]|uniref:DEAD/DEAH box helicase n=1 Tax=Carboxylicivirga linearis TaxID=1628157 RepID=A0ABS5JWZ2_9BACT|nr:DEAD/DEAH box helicase [Carboxylicivirga linearis]MBS2099434.1 DEAD/DEAH box helicase [Carboxylicivirga linearis]